MIAIERQKRARMVLIEGYWLYALWKGSALPHLRRLGLKSKTVSLIRYDRIVREEPAGDA